MNPFHSVGSAPSVEVTGRVRLLPGKGEKAWLSFVGLYTGERFEVETDDSGRFSAKGVWAGDYVLVVSTNEVSRTVKVVTLRVGKNNVVVD
jgi:hypothetical protein